MFCPYCGTQLSDNARFCVSCGNRMPESQPENVEGYYEDYYEEPVRTQKVRKVKAPKGSSSGKKSRLPLFIGIGAAAAAVIVVVVLVFVLGVFKSNEQRIEDATEKTARALTSRMDVTQFIYDYLHGEQFGVEVSADGLYSSIYNFYGGNMSELLNSAELQMAFDRDGNISMNLDTAPYGEEIDAGYYADAESGKRDLAVSFSSITDDVLGVDLSRFGSDMQGSIFFPGRDSSYSLSGVAYGTIAGYGAILAALPEILDINDYQEFIDLIKTDEATRPEYTREKAGINTGSGTLNCDAIKCTYSSEQIKSILKELRNFVEDGVSDIGLDYYNYNIRDYLEDMIESINDSKPALSLEYDIYKGYLVRLLVSYSGSFYSYYSESTGDYYDSEGYYHEPQYSESRSEEVPYAITLGAFFGTDPSRTDSVTVAVDARNFFDFSDEWQEVGTLTFDLSKISDNELYATLDVSTYRDIYFNFGFRYNAGSFELSAWNDYRQFELDGDMNINGNRLVISDPEFYRNGERMIRMRGLDVTFDKAPQIRKLAQDYANGYSNVLKMTEREFDRVYADFEAFGRRITY